MAYLKSWFAAPRVGNIAWLVMSGGTPLLLVVAAAAACICDLFNAGGTYFPPTTFGGAAVASFSGRGAETKICVSSSENP